MAKTPTPTPLTATAMAGPSCDVGASVDAWGDMLNADLDGIDTYGSRAFLATSTWLILLAIQRGLAITASAIPAPYVLPTASTTVLGGVKVDGTTIHAATDGTISTAVVPMGDNRIINGNFAVNQRTQVSGSALAAAVYGHDR